MPKYMIWIMVIVFLPLAALGTMMTASLVKVQNSWATAIAEVKKSNEDQAPRIKAESRSLSEFQKAVTQATIPWDRVWSDVPTTPNQQNASLTIRVGTNQGIVEGMTLYAFRPAPEGFIYVGPFVAAPGSVRNDSATVVPNWALVQFQPYNNTQYEVATWGNPANWRFRTMIPASSKVEFEATIARYQTNIQSLASILKSIGKQNVLLEAAQTQLDQRRGELIGADDPNAEEDPLRPELTKGLVAAIAEEEEARNVLQLDIDALRNAILDVQSEIEAVEAQLTGTSGAVERPARLGSRP